MPGAGERAQAGQAAAQGALPTPHTLDPDGDVTPEGHEAFWQNYIDEVPRAPWPARGSYDSWPTKVAYKCTKADLKAWAQGKSLADASPAAKRTDLLDALARASLAASPELPAKTPPETPQKTVLDALRKGGKGSEGRS